MEVESETLSQMNTETTSQSSAQRVNEDTEQKRNIPVISVQGRLEEESCRKPHGIHLNPRFFGSTNERQPLRFFAPGQNGPLRFDSGPYLPPRFRYDFGPQFDPRFGADLSIAPRFGPGPYVPFGHDLRPPPRFGHDPHQQQMQLGTFNPPMQFAPFPQWHPRFRPNFHPCHGPGNQASYSPGHFPSQPRFGQQSSTGTLNANFPQNIRGPQPPFMRGPAATYTDRFDHVNQYAQSPELHRTSHNTQFYDPRRPSEDPSLGRPYHEVYQGSEDNQYKHTLGDRCLSPNRRKRCNSRSRSRSADSRRQRSFSTSSCSSKSLYDRQRRSHSLSSGSNRSNRAQSDDDSIWNSDEERNSDFDLDLSKPMESLISNVSDSKMLLKGALKCLGSAKVRTMIPLEFSHLSRKEIFHLCHKLLEETDNEELVKVMEGCMHSTPVHDDNGKLSSKISTQGPIGTNNSDSDTDVDMSLIQRGISKRKKSKKKRKRRKKSRLSQSDTESQIDKESSESEDDESTNSSNSAKETLGVTCNPGVSSSNTQQSLLELIQIEYKTKAINVMLKHLGVANEISSMVSNVLQTNGISAVQGLLCSHDILESSGKVSPVEKKTNCGTSTQAGQQSRIDSSHEHDEKSKIESDGAKVESRDKNKTSGTSSDDNDNGNTKAVINRPLLIDVLASENNDDDKDAESVTFDVENENVILTEKELLKEVDDDVLDLQVDAKEAFDLLH